MAFQVVRVTNTGDQDFILNYLDQKLTVPAHGDRIVPWECATSYLGDPRAKNEGSNRDRAHLYEQVRLLHGFGAGLMPATAWEGTGTDAHGTVHGPFKPPLEVHDLDSGDRIYMVIDDPEGLHPFESNVVDTGGVGAQGTDNQFLQAQLDSLQAQQEQILKLLSLQPDAGANPDDDAPHPSGRKAKKSAAAATDEVPEAPAGSDQSEEDTPQTVRLSPNR